jgi:anthraniloyl-CoA monooxygenase
VKLAVLGGGPSGLYWSLLTKKARPEHDITVFERNPAGATYGWGVVFSDRTLTAFREADHPTYVDITERFVLWDAIDVWYRDEVVRSGGHVFAGLARKTLLGILAARCEGLGVDLRFGSRVSDPDELRDFDLVVAADGAGSVARTSLSQYFEPRISHGRSRYIWFGTDRPLDAFTFIFRTNDHGLFQVHAYPFDATTSTFIVECDEEVWRRAGLDEADDRDSITYCEKLFADDLRGHTLLSNNSKWVRFATVKNKRWSHGNMVLLGDAAHTAHFTIGSGTKLAMEDAIALSNALEEFGDLDAALTRYQLERKPVVERFQEAAAESQAYFENARRYVHLEPKQFAFYLLTRSGRIDYSNLRSRDPAFADDFDGWFGGTGTGDRRALLVAPAPMFTPLSLRTVEIANRAVIAPPPTYSCTDGVPSRACARSLLRAARSGAGAVLTETVAVSADGRVTPFDACLYGERQARSWREMVDEIHRVSGAAVCLRLSHAGRRGATRRPIHAVDVPLEEGSWQLLAPSALPYTNLSAAPMEMARTDMDQVVSAFVGAARLADEAGFDLLELHMGHGYLLGSFISPLSNRRADAYGGSPQARRRFPLEVVEAVREAWPEERPLAAAITASDQARNGTGVQDAVAVARELGRRGCDLVEVLAGQTTSDAGALYGRCYLAPYGDVIRNEAHLPVMLSGNITTTVEINTLIGGGRADLCILTPRRPW